MTNAELIKALRYCAEHEGCDYYIAKDCPREDTWVCGADCEQILMIDAAAALEAAEKRTADLEAQMSKEGEWIELDDQICYSKQCSVCGAAVRVCIGEMCTTAETYAKYCPNCGSRMRKGEQE